MAKREAKPAPDNVFSISNNPKFQPKNKVAVFTSRSVNPGELVTYTLSNPIFGLAKDDIIIVKTVFDVGEIKHDTIVLTRINGYETLRCNVPNPEDILGVVVAFQRDIKR